MQHKNINLALNGSIIKWLFALSVPILIGNLLQSSYQFVDAYWVGKVWAEAVAAVSVSGPITFLIISLGTGFSMAGTILIAQYAWAKNQRMVNHVSAQTLLSVVIMGILLGVIWYFSSEFILRAMHVEENVMTLAVPFLQTTFMGLVFVFVFSMFQSILRWVGEVNLPTKIILSTVILNFIIDPIFILGSEKFIPWVSLIPAMGPQWAALATLLTQALSAIIGIYILFSGKYGIHLYKKDFIPDFSFIKKAFFLGFPSSLEMSVRAFGFLMITTLIASFGTAAVAAFWAGGNIFQLILIPAIGFSIATSTMVWQNIWANQLERASKIARTSALVSFGVLEVIWVLVYIFAPFCIELFIHNNPEVTAIGTNFLRTIALTFGFMGIQFAMTGILRASGNMMLTLVLGIISMFVIQFPAAYILSKPLEMNTQGIWIAFVITNIAMAIITVLIYIKWDWKNRKITEEEHIQEEVFEETIQWEGKIM